jgi:peptidoglycan/LPS O-acetylase OafA/YrhL
MQRLPTLDGWRAIAIAGVLVSHSGFLFDRDGICASQVLRDVAANLRLGVDLFFAISGLLITHRLLAEWRERGSFSLKAFYIRRGFRILPPYAVYLACIGILAGLHVLTVNGWEFGSALTFSRNYWMGMPGGAATNHFWSLAVEEHFYLIWPLALSILRPKTALWSVPCAAIGIHLWRAADARYALFARVVTFPPDAGALFRSDTRMDALLWGCFAALVFPQLAAWLQRLARYGSALTLLILTVIVAAIACHARMLPLVLAMLFPMLIVSTVALPGSRISRGLERPAIRRVGDLSYSIYIWQTLFLQSIGVSLNLSSGATGWARVGFWLLDLAALAALAGLSFYFLERPLIAAGRELARQVGASGPERAAVSAPAGCGEPPAGRGGRARRALRLTGRPRWR